MHDLIVVGAGPAGSTAARAAALQGLDTLILEKQQFPRYKPCGGALSDKAASILDFSLPGEICERTITGARVHFRDQVLERHKGYRLTTLITRSRFDHFLLQKAREAGAGVKTQKVLDFLDKGDCVSVQTREGAHQCRFLVIAAGCQSRLKNRMPEPARKERMGVCLVAEIEEDDSKIDERLASTLDIHFGVAQGGYGWIFPHRGYHGVGVGGLAAGLHHPRQAMLQFLKKNGFSEGQRLSGIRYHWAQAAGPSPGEGCSWPVMPQDLWMPLAERASAMPSLPERMPAGSWERCRRPKWRKPMRKSAERTSARNCSMPYSSQK
jgi:geranylgeranyl reductase family protein